MHLTSSCLAVASCLAGVAAAQSREGAYVGQQAGSEITRETFRFDGQVLAATVDLPGRGLRLDTRTEFSARLSPVRYTATLQPLAGGPPLQEIDAAFADSVRWSMASGTATRRGMTGITRPYAIYQNLMFSHLAVALLRYNRVAGGTQVVDLWLPEGARVAQLRMSFTGDSGQVELSGTTMHVRVDRAGWLRAMTIPAQRVSVEWRENLPPAPLARRGTADTLAPSSVVESTVTVPSTVNLAGILTAPARSRGRMPAAVIVAGSGPTDRDGNSRMVRANMYAQLAWGLAGRGIASLRYDKRGVGASGPLVDPEGLTVDVMATDVAAAVRTLAADARFSPVVIIGHGEGAWLALRAAQDAPVAGVILLSSLGRRLEDALAAQLGAQVDSTTARRFRALFPRYLAGEDVGAGAGESLRPLFAPGNRTFMRSLAAFDVKREIARVAVPLLVVHAAQDAQVSVADLEALRQAKPTARTMLVEGANHFYKGAGSRDAMAQLVLYRDPTVPIVPWMLDAVSKWVLALPRPDVSPARAGSRP